MNLAPYIDHTLLKPEAQPAQVSQLCQEAAAYGFASVCVPPCFVPQAVRELRGTSVLVCSVVGFPLGYQTTETKEFETRQLLLQGTQELDMVLNIGALLDRRTQEVEDEVCRLADLCHSHGAVLKVIIETALLTDCAIVAACQLCAAAGADFVKTSTGFASRGASVADVQLMRQSLPAHIRIKAAGGIRTREAAVALVAAGADRIGSSNSLVLLQAPAHETPAT